MIEREQVAEGRMRDKNEKKGRQTGRRERKIDR